MKKIHQVVVLSLILILTISACSSEGSSSISLDTTFQTGTVSEELFDAATVTQSTVDQPDPLTVELDADDLEASSERSGLSEISFEGDSISFQGSGATVDGSQVTITASGNYRISGALDDGQVIVDTQDEGTVFLLLDGAEINSSTSAPIYVRNAEKTVITLVDGTESVVTDAESYVFTDSEDEPDAAIFSNDDLTFNGSGSLTVNANYNHGIASDDDLKIVNGNFSIEAANDGLRGRDSIVVSDGVLLITAGGDGMQSNNDEDAEKGYILIEGGNIDITAGLDGVQAETRLLVSGGTITITSGGGSVEVAANMGWGDRGTESNATSGGSISTKGMKAGVDLTITGGSIQIDSLDDALHSNDSLAIYDGEFQLATSDDGLHADTALTIYGGELTISRSYEGIESAAITINGGNIHLVASDDGINASSGAGGAAGGGPGGGFFESGDNKLTVNGGYIVVDALGDGLDINGPIEMTDGIVVVTGPVANNNGALDYTGEFDISGGVLLAVGSAGMAQAPSASSSQYSLIHNYASTQSAGTVIRVESEDGSGLLTFEPSREYQSVVFSSPDLQNGETYTILAGGDSTGVLTDGIYWHGEYTGGEQVASFTISGMVTSSGIAATGFGGAPGGGGPGRNRP